MKRTLMSFLMLALAFTIVPQRLQAAPATSDYPDYFALKGGYYYPSDRMALNQFSNTDFERKKGYTGEIAFGHHYGPFLGSELGIGYIHDTRFPAFTAGRTRLDALPVLLSLKVFLPLGPIEPYGEVGVGAYFTRFEVEGGPAGPQRFRETDFGPHAGVGVNINFTDTFYLGLEGRYRKVRPDYGGQTVRLDGYSATVNLGFRYR